MDWIAIGVSLLALGFSIYSFVKLLKHRKIETLLQYGDPEGIDLKIKQLTEERINEISKIRDKYTGEIRKLEEEEARKNLKSGATKRNIQKLRKNMQKEARLVMLKYNNEAKMLSNKKELLSKM